MIEYRCLIKCREKEKREEGTLCKMIWNCMDLGSYEQPFSSSYQFSMGQLINIFSGI